MNEYTSICKVYHAKKKWDIKYDLMKKIVFILELLKVCFLFSCDAVVFIENVAVAFS